MNIMGVFGIVGLPRLRVVTMVFWHWWIVQYIRPTTRATASEIDVLCGSICSSAVGGIIRCTVSRSEGTSSTQW